MAAKRKQEPPKKESSKVVSRPFPPRLDCEDVRITGVQFVPDHGHQYPVAPIYVNPEDKANGRLQHRYV